MATQPEDTHGRALDLESKVDVGASKPVAGEGDTPSTMVGSLDLSTRKDRGILRKSIERRWPGLTMELRAEAVQCLKAAMELAKNAGDHRAMLDSVKTVAALESQQQADEHLAEKNARLDSGLPTDGVQVIAIAPPVRARMEASGG